MQIIRRFLLVTSLTAALALLVIWLISFFWHSVAHTGAHAGRFQLGVESYRGRFEILIIPQAYGDQRAMRRSFQDSDAQAIFWYATTPSGPLGFAMRDRKIVESLDTPRLLYRQVEICAPYWSVMSGMLLCPAVIGVRRMRRVLRCERGLCIACGYDLRASHAFCPECGEPSPSPKNRR
jgi:hypothetical protein